MGTKMHYCPDNPEADEAGWVHGPVEWCSMHVRLPRNSGGWRWGAKERARMDREAGIVGTDRGTHISGAE